MAAPRAWGGFDGYRLMPLEEAAAAEEEKVQHSAARFADACDISTPRAGVLTSSRVCDLTRRAAELQLHWIC